MNSEMPRDVTEVDALVEAQGGFVDDVMHALERVIVGQKYMLDRLLVGLLANGHGAAGRCSGAR